jgi:hypothetical protein
MALGPIWCRVARLLMVVLGILSEVKSVILRKDVRVWRLTVEASIVVAHPSYLALQSMEIVLEEIRDRSLVSCDAEEIESTVVDRPAGLGYTAASEGKQLAFGCLNCSLAGRHNIPCQPSYQT